MWDAGAGSLNRMNDSQLEIGVLAEHIKKSVHKKSRCKVEIRAVKGTEAWETAQRLLASLRAGGLDTQMVAVGTAPMGELLIESSHDAAEMALGLQTALMASGKQVQLLVHKKAKPNRIVLHLGSDD
jgi:hypothetical protein